jgi:hypothetical protein
MNFQIYLDYGVRIADYLICHSEERGILYLKLRIADFSWVFKFPGITNRKFHKLLIINQL